MFNSNSYSTHQSDQQEKQCNKNTTMAYSIKSKTESIDYNNYYSNTTLTHANDQEQRHSPSDHYLVTNEDIERFNKLKSEDLNIENSKWLENKPISVLHLDQPDRAVLKIAGT